MPVTIKIFEKPCFLHNVGAFFNEFIPKITLVGMRKNKIIQYVILLSDSFCPVSDVKGRLIIIFLHRSNIDSIHALFLL